MSLLRRGVILALGLLAMWQLAVWWLRLPFYFVPTPLQVLDSAVQHVGLIMSATAITFYEAVAGLLLGSVLGVCGALAMLLFRPLRFWLLPLLLISQAIPTFAIAPVLVLWFGYGVATKIVVTAIMLFFPVISAFFDGLRRTPSAWLDVAQTSNATRWRSLWMIRAPAALPALASGLRVATAFAPMGAVIGEWVGASRGLGFLLLNANARMQTALMFACLISLVVMALALYFAVDWLLRYVLSRVYPL